MNALASVLPANMAASAPASTSGAVTRADDDSAADKSGFAQCMAHAQQSQAAPPKEEEPAVEDARAETPADTAVAVADADASAIAPDLAALLPGWAAAVPTVAVSDGAASNAAAAAGDGDVALAPNTKAAKPAAAANASGAPPALSTPEVPAGAERPDDQGPATPAHEAVARPAAELRAKGPETALTAAPGVAPPAAPVATPRPIDVPTPMAHLPAPIDTPAFAPALATQVRWWTQDGVQQAQLTLSPPEMGPVTVKIVLHEQREARIDFVADVAATRSALEAALPVLAAALDESGLKLSGGGVHDGAAQRQALWQQAQQQPPSTRGADAAAAASAPSVTAGHSGAALRPHGARGLVDLVA